MRSAFYVIRTAAVTLALGVIGSCSGWAWSAEPDKTTLLELQVSPAVIELTGVNRRQQLLITGVFSDGSQADFTRACRLELADPEMARVDGSILSGRANGETELIVVCESSTLRVPVSVSGFGRYPAVHFQNDIIPLFAKHGCNSGGCHGKASGQNGFKLSVFGHDPQSDFNAIVHDARGRRVFPASPSSSLLVRKATGRVPHGGGRRVEPHSDDDELLLQWIQQGMPWGEPDAPQIEAIAVQPDQRTLTTNAIQQLQVVASFSDGRIRDVTSAAAYTSNSELVAEVNQTGEVRTGSVAGEAAITINYMGFVTAARMIVPQHRSVSNLTQAPTHNTIDTLVWKKLDQLGISAAPLCDDATFHRRAWLDLTGSLPSSDDTWKFLDERDEHKRSQLVEDLLQRPEYADYWATRWADVLLADRNKIGERGAYQFHQWLRQQIAINRPYDEWVRELLTATGNSGKYGPVNFFRAARTPEDLTKSVSQAFLGIRLDCAQCHHHPFDRWGQEDFYGLSGFFTGIKYQALGSDRDLVFHAGHRPASVPITGERVETRPPGGPVLNSAAQSADPRIPLANWVTAPDNPYFARLAVNRIWSHLLGRGLVEPVDDLRLTNPATNEPLLDFLAAEFVRQDFDLKAVQSLIMNSAVYQLAAETNPTNERDQANFSRHLVRRLPAEVLLDAICRVSGVPEQFPGMPQGTRAIQLWDNRLPSYFLDSFGRSPRESPCECGRSGEPTMAQALHLMNAPEINAKLTDPNGRAAQLAASQLSRDELVEELTLLAIGRRPTPEQLKVASQLFEATDRRTATEDYLWILLNSYDFIFVH